MVYFARVHKRTTVFMNVCVCFERCVPKSFDELEKKVFLYVISHLPNILQGLHQSQPVGVDNEQGLLMWLH